MASSTAQIWIVEDDPFFAQSTQAGLRQKLQCDVRIFSSGEAALQARIEDPDIVILDYHIGDGPDSLNGLAVLRQLRERRPELPVLAVSGQDNVQTTVEFFKEGAWDYVLKTEANTQDKIVEAIRSLMRLVQSQEYLNWARSKRRKEWVRLGATALAAVALVLATLLLT